MIDNDAIIICFQNQYENGMKLITWFSACYFGYLRYSSLL